jgi:hypothetical protein
VSFGLCQTDPSTGSCMAAASSSVTTTIAANTTLTFTIFPAARATIPFDSTNNRVFVRFTDGADIGRGATSVAVSTH